MKISASVDDNFIAIEPEFFTLDELMEHFVWKESDINKYKRIALKVGVRYVVFGSWLFTKKKVITRICNEYYIDPDSFEAERILLVKGALKLLFNSSELNITLGSKMGHIQILVDWLNSSGNKMPTEVNEAKVLFRTYHKYLEQMVKVHDPRKTNAKRGFRRIGQTYASRAQKTALALLSEIFEVEEKKIKGLTPIIPGLSHRELNYVKIDEEKLDETLSYCFQFFEQTADFCLNAKHYPHKIYLLEHEALLVVEPTLNSNIITPFTGGRHDYERYWDIKRGILRNDAEVEFFVKNTEQYRNCTWPSKKNRILEQALESLRKKQVILAAVNQDRSHLYRLELGIRAMRAYFLVLLDVTGINDSTLATIKWEDDNFVEEVAEKGLRNIKRRAGNKEVLFTIQSIFMKSFRIFLKLRSFILNGHTCNTLFFVGTGEDAHLDGQMAKGGYGSYCYRSLASLYPNLTYTGSRMLRQYKKRWAMKRTKGKTFLVAALLQHKPEISEQFYPHETKAESQNLMGSFFNYQHRIIMKMDPSKQTSVGGCDSTEHVPQADSELLPYKPDCQKKMTCLFCTFYRVKPESDDIRKVVSLEYIINRHSILHARSSEHFELVMKPVLDRIDILLKAMIQRYPQTEVVIDEIRKDVYEYQNLHWYWEAKLQLHWELGWV